MIAVLVAAAQPEADAVDWWARAIGSCGLVLAATSLGWQRVDSVRRRRGRASSEVRRQVLILKKALEAHPEPQLVALELWSARHAAALEALRDDRASIADRRSRRRAKKFIALCDRGRGPRPSMLESHEQRRSVNKPVDPGALDEARTLAGKMLARLDRLARHAP